jgi:hypothetical protein
MKDVHPLRGQLDHLITPLEMRLVRRLCAWAEQVLVLHAYSADDQRGFLAVLYHVGMQD